MAFIDISDQLEEHTSVFEQLAGFTLEGTDPVDIEQIWLDIDRAAELTGSADSDTEAWLIAGELPEDPKPDELDAYATAFLQRHDLSELRRLDVQVFTSLSEAP